MKFETKRLPPERDAIAPDGSDVRILLGLDRGGMAHFQLGPGQISGAVAHKTVEEIWYILAGNGEMWRKQEDREETVALEPGLCLSVPVGTHFQFRTVGDVALAILGITMPPWPGPTEAYPVTGKWQPKAEPNSEESKQSEATGRRHPINHSEFHDSARAN